MASVDSSAMPAGSIFGIPARFLLWALFAAIFGGLVGAAELMSRYRDDPLQAMKSAPASVYVILNAITSAAAFALLLASRQSIFPEASDLSLVLIAGFGAMTLLRSKILTFRTASGDDVPIGVDVVISSFLRAADRSIDRHQAVLRWDRAFQYLHDIPDEKTFVYLADYFGTNLVSYQSVSPEEREDFKATIETLEVKQTINVGLRAVAAGLAFQEIAGSQNFDRVVKEFRKRPKLPPSS